MAAYSITSSAICRSCEGTWRLSVLAVLEIGNPLKLRWSLDRQVSRFLAHEDEVNVPSRLAKLIVGDKFFR